MWKRGGGLEMFMYGVTGPSCPSPPTPRLHHDETYGVARIPDFGRDTLLGIFPICPFPSEHHLTKSGKCHLDYVLRW